MTIVDFCKNLSAKFGGGESLAYDFKWLIDCGNINAYYGYGPRELFNSNSTARDLMMFYKDNSFMEKAILACGKIGWGICAEDDDYVVETMATALA